MSNFILTAESGVSVNAISKTLERVKREATAWMTHGGKGITVCDQNF